MSMRERGSQHFWMGGQALMEGNYPLMGRGSHTPLHIGQPCSYSFLDSRSSLIVRQLKLSQMPLIIGEGGGGVIIGKLFLLLFTCFRAYRSLLNNKSFLQEKNGNILVGGYPPPLLVKANIFPVCSYEGFPYAILKHFRGKELDLVRLLRASEIFRNLP